MKPILPILRKISLFRNLKPAELSALAKHSQVRSFPAGSKIFGKGDKPDYMFIVVSGKIKIYSRSDTKIRTTFAYILPGEFFGEMALLSTEPRSASAESAAESNLLLIHKREFSKLLRLNPSFSADLLHNLSARLRHADEQIENILFQN